MSIQSSTYSQEKIIYLLVQKGYDHSLAAKMVSRLKPATADQGEKYLTRVNGKWGHEIIYSKEENEREVCLICGESEQAHIRGGRNLNVNFHEEINGSMVGLLDDSIIPLGGSVDKSDSGQKRTLHAHNVSKFMSTSGNTSRKLRTEEVEIKPEQLIKIVQLPSYSDDFEKISLKKTSRSKRGIVTKNKDGDHDKEKIKEKATMEKDNNYPRSKSLAFMKFKNFKSDFSSDYDNCDSKAQNYSPNEVDSDKKQKYKSSVHSINVKKKGTNFQKNIHNFNDNQRFESDLSHNDNNRQTNYKYSRTTQRKIPSPRKSKEKIRSNFATQRTFKPIKKFKSITSINQSIVNLNLNIGNSVSIRCVRCSFTGNGMDNKSNALKLLKCEHVMCIKCISELIETSVEIKKNLSLIKCAELNCNEQLDHYFIMFMIYDNLLMIKYLKLYYEKDIISNGESHNSVLIRCPFCDGYGLRLLFKRANYHKNEEKPVETLGNINSLKWTMMNYKSESKGNNDNKDSDSIFEPIRDNFIRCENSHWFCEFCHQKAHPYQKCDQWPEKFDSEYHQVSINKVTAEHINPSLTVNQMKNIHKVSCPRCNYMNEKPCNSTNSLTCENCHNKFCCICGSEIYDLFHYYSPFNFCLFMEHSDLDSLFVTSILCKLFRHFIILLVLIGTVCPLLAMFGSVIMYCIFSRRYPIEKLTMGRIYERSHSGYENNTDTFTEQFRYMKMFLLIPKLTSIGMSVYLMAFNGYMSIFALVLIIVSPGWLFFKYTRRTIIG